MFLGRRFGRFRVTRSHLDDGLGDMIYVGLIPLEVRYLVDCDGWEVLASSLDFDVVEEGCDAPRYDIIWHSKKFLDEEGFLQSRVTHRTFARIDP